MSKYYYSDPLASAWMAKHFGVTFANGDSLRSALEAAEQGDCTAMPWVIHPDSLHLLEPREGDLIAYLTPRIEDIRYSTITKARFSNLYGEGMYKKIPRNARCPKEWEVLYMTEDFDDWNIKPQRIIQRNGRVFHWPEREASEPSQSSD